MRYSVDSVQEGVARLIPEEGAPLLVYLSVLPDDCREGALLEGGVGTGFFLLADETAETRRALAARTAALCGKKRG